MAGVKVVYGDFKGMDTRTPADHLDPSHARLLQNLFIDRGTLRLRGGSAKFNASEVSGGAVQGLFRYYPYTGSAKMLIVVGGKLYHSAGLWTVPPTASFTEVKSVAAASLAAGTGDVTFVQQGNVVYFVSGSGGPWYYDGTNWFLIDAPAKPASAPTLQPKSVTLINCNSVTGWASNDVPNTPVTLETSIVRKGSGSIKVTTTVGASKNDIVYYDFGGGNEKNLQGRRQLAFWLRSSVTGVPITFGIGEQDPTSSGWDYSWSVEVLEANAWQQVIVDLTEVLDSSATAGEGKDNLRYFGIQVLEDTAAANIYLDQIEYSGGLHGDYLYRYSYYNAATGLEGPDSDDAAVSIGDGMSQTVALEMATSGSAANTIRIYRKGGQSSVWRLVTSQADSGAGTQTHTDPKADYLLGAIEGSARGDPPTDASVLAIFKNRAVYSGVSTQPNRIYLSNYEEPRQIPALTLLQTEPNAGGYIDVTANSGDAVTGFSTFGDRLLIFKRNSVWALVGTTFQDFVLQLVTDECGCASHKSIAQYQNGVLWYTGKDVIHFTAEGMTVVSDPVRTVLDGISTSYWSQVCGLVSDLKYFFFYTPTGGSYNTGGLAYDLRKGGWTKVSGWNARCLVRLSGGNDRQGCYYGDSNAGYVWRMNCWDNSIYTDGGSAIAWEAQFPDLSAGDSSEEKAVTEYRIVTKNVDERMLVEVNADQGRKKLQNVHSMQNAKAGDEVPEQSIVVWKPKRLPGKQVRLEVSGSADSEIELHRIEVEVGFARQLPANQG
jgi:hypothetical protein